MKTNKTIFLSIALLLGLSACGVNQAWILNQNQHTTQVQLSKRNYRHISQVSGTAEVSYVLIFGGANKRVLYNAAYRDMLDKAALSGARSLTHVLSEEHIGGAPPFFYKRTVTVSAQVIEFTE